MTTTTTKARGKAARASKTTGRNPGKAKPAEAATPAQPGAVTAAEVRMIPLSQLVPSADNVRRGPAEGIEALAGNIAAVGLLSSLSVTAEGESFAVAGGERRRQALVLLAQRGQIAADHPVPCRIVAQALAVEASLSENIHRLAMNPADQFEAWAKLAGQGQTPKEIARRHGTNQRMVKARLRLGRLSPRILDALRSGRIDEATAQAFCWTEDREAQETVFDTLSKSGGGRIDAYSVRRLLTDKDADLRDARLMFVGEKAYRAAGGSVREDLFGEQRTFPDTALLSKLALDKMQQAAERYRAAGWGRVSVSVERDAEAMSGLRPLPWGALPMSDADAAEHARLAARIEELEEADADDAEAMKALQDCQDAIGEIDARHSGYAAEDKARATLFLYLTYGGTMHEAPMAPAIPAPADAADGEGQDEAPDRAGQGGTGSRPQAETGPRYGLGLLDDLAAIRRATLQADFLASPAVAQDLLRFHLARAVLADALHDSPFNARAGKAYNRIKSAAGDMGQMTAHARVERAVGQLRLDWAGLEDTAQSFRGFRALEEADRTALMAYAAALSLEGHLASGKGADAALNAACLEMQADPAAHWTPDATFFGRLTKAHILALMRELLGPEIAARHSGDKKGALAERMAFYFDASGTAAERSLTEEAAARAAAWTPEPIRPVRPDAQG